MDSCRTPYHSMWFSAYIGYPHHNVQLVHFVFVRPRKKSSRLLEGENRPVHDQLPMPSPDLRNLIHWHLRFQRKIPHQRKVPSQTRVPSQRRISRPRKAQWQRRNLSGPSWSLLDLHRAPKPLPHPARPAFPILSSATVTSLQRKPRQLDVETQKVTKLKNPTRYLLCGLRVVLNLGTMSCCFLGLRTNNYCYNL